MLTSSTYPVLKLVDGKPTLIDEPALSAINMRLRDDYSKDCQGGVSRWNKIIEKAGIKFQLTLPSVAFHRHIGEFRNVKVSPDGKLLNDEQWIKNQEKWLPTKDDGAFIQSLMKPQWERGQFASWISAPKIGIDNKAGDFEYVKIHRA